MMTVNDRIKAVYVLQRFVMMSRKLIPRFSELMAKKDLSEEELERIESIKDVYDTFEASSDISERLVNSNIFQLIKDVYNTTIKMKGETPHSFYIYDAFLNESDRLIATWNKHCLN